VRVEGADDVVVREGLSQAQQIASIAGCMKIIYQRFNTDAEMEY
jgi:hypothetical protein